MNRREQTFTSQRATEVMEQIREFVAKRGMVTSTEVIAMTGLSPSQTFTYLNRMADMDTIYLVARGERGQGSSEPSTWALGAAPAGHSSTADVAMRRVIVRKEWEPNHVRMAMDCYLFGVPAALQEAV